MTTREWKTIARILKEVYAEVKIEALAKGIDLLSPEYDKLISITRERVLTHMGFTLEEYQQIKEELASANKKQVDQYISDIKSTVESIPHIPTSEEITSIAHEVSSQYIKPPQVTNQIIKEVTIEKPTIVKETKTINKEFDPSSIYSELGYLNNRLDNLKIPEPVNLEPLKKEINDNIVKQSQTLKDAIDIEWGSKMPDFRKLAMGLESEIDSVRRNSTTLSGTINQIAYFNSATTISSLTTTTYPSLTELSYVKGVTSAIQTQLNTKVDGSGDTNKVAYWSDSNTLTYDTTNLTFDPLDGTLHAQILQSGYAAGDILIYADANGTISPLDTLTYPSLTELSYLKGVTSAVQTQLNSKGTGTIGGSTGSTDKSILIANGVGGSTLQSLGTSATLATDGTGTFNGVTIGTYGGAKGITATGDFYFVASGGTLFTFVMGSQGFNVKTNSGVTTGLEVVYGTNYGYLKMGSNFSLYPSTGELRLGANNVENYWAVNTSGHFMAGTDNVNDIGASAATRPRTIYLGTSVVTPGINVNGDGLISNLKAGTYTPTVSNATNTDSTPTVTQAQYMRVGNTVTISGRFTADPTTTATATSFEMTLPIASNIGAVEDCAGVAFCGSIAGMGAEIIGVVANDTAKIQWISSDITSKTWSYTFSYRVI